MRARYFPDGITGAGYNRAFSGRPSAGIYPKSKLARRVVITPLVAAIALGTSISFAVVTTNLRIKVQIPTLLKQLPTSFLFPLLYSLRFDSWLLHRLNIYFFFCSCMGGAATFTHSTSS